MKRILLIAILALMKINGYSQEDNYKFLLGASFSFTHDDLNNNKLLSNYFSYDKNFTNTMHFSGEFGKYLTSRSVMAIEIEYLLSRSNSERKISGLPNSEVFDLKSSGISINPSYKLLAKISDKIWYYTDFKIVLQYLNHENKVSQLNVDTYEFDYLNMNGNEFNYGLAIDPGLIFKINRNVEVVLDYSLLRVVHSTIEKAGDNEVEFESIEGWDYGLNMKLTGFNLGMIFTF